MNKKKNINLPAKSMRDSLTNVVSQIAKYPGNDIDTIKEMKCLATFKPSNVYLGGSRISGRYYKRPHLVVQGWCSKIKCAFDENTTWCMNFAKDSGDKMTFIYNFNNEQLAELTKMGLFDEGFECPDIFNECEFEDMPVKCDMIVLQPKDETLEPVFFVDIRDAYLLEYDINCGYDLASYFESIKEKEVEVEDKAPSYLKSEIEWKSDKFLDLNSDKELEDVSEAKQVQSEVAEKQAMLDGEEEEDSVAKTLNLVEQEVLQKQKQKQLQDEKDDVEEEVVENVDLSDEDFSTENKDVEDKSNSASPSFMSKEGRRAAEARAKRIMQAQVKQLKDTIDLEDDNELE